MVPKLRISSSSTTPTSRPASESLEDKGAMLNMLNIQDLLNKTWSMETVKSGNKQYRWARGVSGESNDKV